MKLVEEMSLGELDGPPERALGAIQFVTAHPSGDIYIFDAKDTQIRRYDKTGRYLGKIGRKGRGPGEYERLSGLTIADETLIVCEGNSLRMSQFTRQGEFVALRIVPGAVFRDDKDCLTDSQGLVYRWTENGTHGYTCGALGRTSRGAMYLRFDRSLRLVDSVRVPEACSDRHFILETSDGTRRSFPAESVAVAYGGGGVMFGLTTEYRVVVQKDAGRTLTMGRSIERIPMEEPERRQWEAFPAYFRSLRPSSAYPPLPKRKPVFRDLMSDREGRVWVHLYTNAENRIDDTVRKGSGPLLTWKERNTYDVFDKDGTYLWQLTLRPGARLLAIVRDRLYVTAAGAEGEERLTVYRIVQQRDPRRK